MHQRKRRQGMYYMIGVNRNTQCLPKLKGTYDSQIWIVTQDFKLWKMLTLSTPKIIIFAIIEFWSKPACNNECIMHFVKMLTLDPLTTYIRNNKKGLWTQLSST
jgi:hypothetical protein